MSYRIPTSSLAAALVVAGCGGGNDKPTTSGSPPATSANTPYGLYVRTVTKQDIARTAKLRDEHGVNATAAAPPTGRYRLVIAKGAGQDVIKVTDPTGFTVDQDMDVAPGVLRITSYVDPAKAVFCGVEVPAQATYRFRAAGSSLRLQPRSADPCADRDSMLTGTWSKS
jgi:hypothetical protein